MTESDRERIFDLRDDLVEEASEKLSNNEFNLKEFHEEVKRIQRDFRRALRDIEQSNKI